MKNVFRLTNKNIVLLTPLLLYSLVSSVYLAASSIGGKPVNMIFAMVLFFLMTGAFIAGWFYMIKQAVSTDSDGDDIISTVKDFPAGVGEYFLPSLGLIFNVIVFSLLLLFGAYQLGLHFIGEIGVPVDALAKAMESAVTLKAFISSLSMEQLAKINNWNILILSTMSVTYFLVLLYAPTMFFKEKNFLKAFFISLKDLFSKKFIKTLSIYFLIFLGNFIVSILSALFSTQAFVHFFLTLFNFYFITLVSVGVFYYYYNSFIKPQIGQNIDVKI